MSNSLMVTTLHSFLTTLVWYGNNGSVGKFISIFNAHLIIHSGHLFTLFVTWFAKVNNKMFWQEDTGIAGKQAQREMAHVFVYQPKNYYYNVYPENCITFHLWNILS